ncbi:response regulator [Anaerolineales bacterium HSG6]|nr:response regulator [Anaerolineales bacterium HSG6]MDM8530413.1 response regulator [Anaerolineales bacterium HSG25]
MSEKRIQDKVEAILNNSYQADALITDADLPEIISQLRESHLALQEAKISAEEANKTKSNFLADMSHELRTPLSSILGYAQILQMDPNLSEGQAKKVAAIQSGGEHLITLTSDILDISKIEAGRMELYLSELELPDFIESIVEMFRVTTNQKGVSFKYDQPTPIPLKIIADETHLRQVLINLLGNAVKFTEQGHVDFMVELTESITTRHVEGNAESVCTLKFTIEDSGIGIAQEDLEVIFSPFKQVNNESLAQGAGLGLAISQQLTEMMGSKIQVTSVVGQGSRFWLELTLPVTSTELKEPVKTAKTITGFNGTPLKLLIVDDERNNRILLRKRLKKFGFKIEDAADGIYCLEKAEQFQPDIILLDLHMPNLGGIELTQQLRAMPSYQDVIIIAVSADSKPDIRAETLEVGCHDFLPKPIDIQELLSIIDLYLEVDWTYEAKENSDPNQLSMALPPLTERIALYNLALDGDIDGIIDQLTQIEQLNDSYQMFIKKIRDHAENYQTDVICQLLEKYQE